jgi:two-component system, LytTR family, response regulator
MTISSVIVEDEPAARAVLKSYLTKYCPQVELLGEASDIREALPLLERTRPQLVFLDVEMPYGNAFDLLEACKAIPFETIFVTAFSEYAVKALNWSAAYYLLKPVSIEELVAAVHRVEAHLASKIALNRNQILMENLRESRTQKQQLVLPTLDGFEVVRLENIVRFRGNGNFTDVHLADGSKKMVCRFLKHFEEILAHPFQRVHKTHIINVDFVKAYHKSGYISLLDGSEVEVSPTYKEAFLACFER